MLNPSELKKIDAYWRASNYLAAGQLYLLDNPMLRRPLTRDDVKKKIVGHWGTVPGQNFVYVHLNRVIKKYDQDMILISGPGRQPCGGHSGSNVKEQCQIRRKTAERPLLKRLYFLAGKPLAAHLIGISSIGKAVRKHPAAGLQSRPNDPLNMIGAGGKEEERFSIRRHIVGKEHGADFFRQRRSARLTRVEDADALIGQMLEEAFRLRGLARTVNAFNRNEAPQHALNTPL